MKTLLVLGSTGVVGQAVLALALKDERVEKIVAVTRKPLSAGLLANPRVMNPVVDFQNLPADAPWWKADAVICTLGTTIKIAKTAEAFREVDLHIPSRAAALAVKHGTPCFVLNSSMMANPRAGGLYLRTKGEVEQAIQQAGFASVVLARPGLLDGERQESRLGEEVGVWVSRVFNPVLPKRFRSVKVEKLARVMLEHALLAPAGCTVLESERFQ